MAQAPRAIAHQNFWAESQNEWRMATNELAKIIELRLTEVLLTDGG